MYEQYASSEFEQAYTYTGSDLGAVCSGGETFFRLWAPTAQNACVRLYASGDPERDDLIGLMPMQQDVQGTWVAHCRKDLRGVYYTFVVTADGTEREACDPYARAVGVNGCRAMIIDLPATNPEGWDEDIDPHYGSPITDAVIYELHVRDFSMQRGLRFQHRGKYLAFTESGRITKGGQPVGLDHLRSLGITHVHLLPVFDFGSSDESRPSPQYNWGYDPVNFNAPEGSYATDAHDGAVRVREFKQMVKSLHDAGISVIMDVVYNHVYDGGGFCFNRLVPGYFSRISSDGVYSNGSFCGNDTASERSMVRKFIVDSVLYWAEEYHIDGFRFDIASLLDVQTIRSVMDAVHRNHPNVLFYGEGWHMNTCPTKPNVTLAVRENSSLLPGFAFFSDTIRDALRGRLFDQTAPGFVCGGETDRGLLDACFTGTPSWAAQPEQCVNYVSCHDNTTLSDRITTAAPKASLDTRIRMNKLAAAFCMLSQGVPFFQAGEEMLRTKPGRSGSFDENSYRSPDKVNSLKWDTLDDPAYEQTVRYYKGLIAFRKAHPSLRLRTRADVAKLVSCIPCDDPQTAVYRITEGPDELYVIFNAAQHPVAISLPQGKPWQIHIQGSRAGIGELGQAQQQVTVEPISTMVLSRKRMVDVVAALIWEKDRFLICQRPASKARGLLWEFVGGKVEPGETMESALVRECREELGITVRVGSAFTHVIHDYPDILIRLTLYHCVIADGVPQLLEHNALAWIHPSQIGAYDFCPADTDILKKIHEAYGNNPPLT